MQPDGPGHSHGPTHGHSHGDGPQARWGDLLTSPPLLATAVLLAVAFAATIIGLVMLWPDGQGQEAAVQQASWLQM